MSTNNEANESDVPPLEDMSELVEQARQLQQQREKQGATSNNSGGSTSSVPGPDQGRKGNGSLPKKDDSEKDHKKEEKSEPKPKSASTFGGMKKGFLFGSPPKSSKLKGQQKAKGSDTTKQDKGSRPTKDNDDIPLIKPKTDGPQGVAERIPGFMESVKAGLPDLKNQEWLTDDLIKKIEKRPHLVRQLTDPHFTQALTMFQKDPQTAAKKYGDDKDVQNFFKEFFEILGDHAVEKGKPPPPSPAQRARLEEEAHLKKVLSDPEVRAALEDHRIKKILELLKTDPDRAQWMVKTADAELQRHLRLMVDKGLLAMKFADQ